MEPAKPPIEPRRGGGPGRLPRDVLTFLVPGVACGLAGTGLVLVSLFSDDPQLSPLWPVLGFVLAGVGGAVAMLGVRKLPIQPDATLRRSGRGAAPRPEGVVRGTPIAPDLSRNDRVGRGGPEAFGTKVQHGCGAWNEPDNVFCKGCGRGLTERPCSSCGSQNDPDARFCRRCGAVLLPRERRPDPGRTSDPASSL